MSVETESASYQLLINGEFCNSRNGETFAVHNPATGEVLARVTQAGPADVEAAVEAARNALERGGWGRTSGSKRGKLLSRLADIFRSRIDALAALETRNNGKPVSSVRGELNQAAEVLEYYAGAAGKIQGTTVPLPGGYVCSTYREPVGVCAQIIPWNYPLLMACWKIAPALAAGNTVILKPASYTPLTALELGRLCLEAGIPPGVVNVLSGPGSTVGQALASHPGVDKVAFTGETATGREVMAAASGTIKRVSLELGGKSPNIVFEDADLEQAAAGAVFAIFYNAGQSCDARSLLLVHQKVMEEFTKLVVEKAQRIRVGDPRDPATQVGPLISGRQWDRVDGYVRLALQEGAAALCGASRPDFQDSSLSRGHFYRPTVLSQVSPEARVVGEEIFGPVVVLLPFRSEEEAVSLANSTPYGLAATVWTTRVDRAHRMAAALKSGLVGINAVHTVFPGVPFGGYRQSGFGREMGLETLDMYTETKSVVTYIGEKPVNPFGV